MDKVRAKLRRLSAVVNSRYRNVWYQIISLRRSFFELHILETQLLPSDVIKISFYRPPNFTYRSGQWIRVSCNVVGYTEYHSLTITSAPHEDVLSLHIKARGPWTWRLRNYFDPNVPRVNEEPLLNKDGREDDGGAGGRGDAESTRAKKGEQQLQPRIRLQVSNILFMDAPLPHDSPYTYVTRKFSLGGPLSQLILPFGKHFTVKPSPGDLFCCVGETTYIDL